MLKGHQRSIIYMRPSVPQLLLTETVQETKILSLYLGVAFEEPKIRNLLLCICRS